MKIYYNPSCSKCVAALDLLETEGEAVEVIRYLDTPPTAEELRELLDKLGISPLELIRQKEALFQEAYADKQLSDEGWIEVMLAHPILIERPIVVKGDHAIIGRPPKKVLGLL